MIGKENVQPVVKAWGEPILDSALAEAGDADARAEGPGARPGGGDSLCWEDAGSGGAAGPFPAADTAWAVGGHGHEPDVGGRGVIRLRENRSDQQRRGEPTNGGAEGGGGNPVVTGKDVDGVAVFAESLGAGGGAAGQAFVFRGEPLKLAQQLFADGVGVCSH
ncbi:MAG: hypothetical protein N3I86_06685 [Verrucomicrobiae bacterium]|nr:hypothetical protein [Verrucomicrobiae bacterium]MDW8310113.1 hypothetical protein [Verrucomicrobiales bacterium]